MYAEVHGDLIRSLNGRGTAGNPVGSDEDLGKPRSRGRYRRIMGG